MSLGIIFNSIGLLFDIAGVILLFYYEPPKDTSHLIFWDSGPTEEEEDKTFKTKRQFSKLGLVLLLVGFGLQLISNFLK